MWCSAGLSALARLFTLTHETAILDEGLTRLTSKAFYGNAGAMKGMARLIFGFGCCSVVLIGWTLGTSGLGYIGFGIMMAVMIFEGIIYNQVTKPKKEKPKDTNRRRRR